MIQINWLSGATRMNALASMKLVSNETSNCENRAPSSSEVRTEVRLNRVVRFASHDTGNYG